MADNPTPQQIREQRTLAGLTQTQAATIVHAGLRSWQEWEKGDTAMHPGLWELFMVRSSARRTPLPAGAVEAMTDLSRYLLSAIRKMGGADRQFDVLTLGHNDVHIMRQLLSLAMREVISGNPHAPGTLAHDVWSRGYAGKKFTGHAGSAAEGWHQAGAAARQLLELSHG